MPDASPLRPSLAILPGLPFARMARVLVREWGLSVNEVEHPFPLPPELFGLNPLGQLPVLLVEAEAVFPTLVVLERLWAMAGRPDGAFRPEEDRQILLTTLLAGDALVAALYQGWSGLGPVGANHIGYDRAARNLERVRHVLAWLAARLPRRDVSQDVTVPEVALACLLLWSEARGGPLGRAMKRWRIWPSAWSDGPASRRRGRRHGIQAEQA